MRKPLKTLFLLEDLCFGGTQKQNLALACGMDRERFSPLILTLSGPTDLDQKAIDQGIQPMHLGSSRKTAPFFFLRLASKLAELKPDILVPCTALPNIWGRIWGKILGIPVIIGTCRGGGAPFRQHERFLWHLCDHIVCNSQALAAAMRARGAPQNHLSFIPNGVDSDYFCPAKTTPGKPLVVCVARLAGDKDHATLLKAFEIVAKKIPEARLRLVGEGPEAEKLRKLAAKMPVAQNIEFAGASSNPLPHYQQAAVFALSSAREGQPNVILEAMSCGVPVCATNVGGIPALVGQNETGLLSEAGDFRTLAKNLLQILENPEYGKKLGNAGRERVKQGFSFTAMINAHQELFERMWNNSVKRKQ